MNKKCVWTFSTTFVWHISHYKKNLARYYHQCTFIFMLSIHNSCQILMKLGFSQQMFEWYSNIKFHVSLSSGSQAVPWNRRTDRYDAANSHFCTILQMHLKTSGRYIEIFFLVFNFRRVLNVICSFLGNSPASEF